MDGYAVATRLSSSTDSLLPPTDNAASRIRWISFVREPLPVTDAAMHRRMLLFVNSKSQLSRNRNTSDFRPAGQCSDIENWELQHCSAEENSMPQDLPGIDVFMDYHQSPNSKRRDIVPLKSDNSETLRFNSCALSRRPNVCSHAAARFVQALLIVEWSTDSRHHSDSPSCHLLCHFVPGARWSSAEIASHDRRLWPAKFHS
jgi:hypothetical protein